MLDRVNGLALLWEVGADKFETAPVESSLSAPDATMAGVAARNRGSTASNWAQHNFYRYPARFSPTFARQIILAFSKPGYLVFDPFMVGVPRWWRHAPWVEGLRARASAAWQCFLPKQRLQFSRQPNCVESNRGARDIFPKSTCMLRQFDMATGRILGTIATSTVEKRGPFERCSKLC